MKRVSEYKKTETIGLIRQHLKLSTIAYLYLYGFNKCFHAKIVAVKNGISSLSFTMVKLNLIPACWLAGGRNICKGGINRGNLCGKIDSDAIEISITI